MESKDTAPSVAVDLDAQTMESVVSPVYHQQVEHQFKAESALYIDCSRPTECRSQLLGASRGALNLILQTNFLI